MRSAAGAPDFQAMAAQLGGHCRSRGELRQHIMDARTSTASVALVDRPFVLLTSCSSISDRNPHTFSIPSSLASFVRARARCSLQTTNLEIYQREMLARLFALLLAVAPAASCECGADYPRCVPQSAPIKPGWCEGDPDRPVVYDSIGLYSMRREERCILRHRTHLVAPPPSPPPPSPRPFPFRRPHPRRPHPRRPAAPVAQMPIVFHYRLPAMGAGAG